MMRFFSILSTALLFPVMAEAKVYDLADIATLNEICVGDTFKVQGTTYTCSSAIRIPEGAHIENSTQPQQTATIVAYGNVLLKGQNNIGSETTPINIKTEGANLEIVVENTGQPSQIVGNLTSHGLLSIEDTIVFGDIKSSGGSISLKGQSNFVFGDIHALRKVELEQTQIEGDVYAGSSSSNIVDTSLLAKDSVVNGNLTSNGNIKLVQAKVCGDLQSIGQHISSEGGRNLIVGNTNAFSTVDFKNIDIFGTKNLTDSVKGNKVTIDAISNVYAPELAVNSFQQASLQDTSICGFIYSAVPVATVSKNYCGFDDLDCTYSNQLPKQCPMPDEIPICDITPPTDDDFDLVVTPAEDMALMCGDELPQFTVTTTNNGEMTSAHVLASLSDPNLFTLEMVEGKQKIDENNFISKDDGTLIVKVVPNNIDAIALDANYTLTFTMVDDTNKMQTVQFMFTPYMFEAYAEDLSSLKEIHVIAGKSQTVDTRLLACATTGEQVIATNYDGKPQITHPLIKPAGGSEGNFSYSADFKDGLSSHGLITNESGLFSVKMSDRFECSGFAECPDEGSVYVEGTFDVKSRPWTLAICDGSTALASGTSKSGPGFIAAGEHFSLTVKPIIWQSGGSVTDEVNTKSYCNADVTHNFMLEDAPAASIVISSKQKTPTETANQSEKLLESTLSLTRSHTESENSQYTFSGLYWEEVGSLKIKASLSGQYLDMTVNTGFRNVGRFYAKYFKVREAEWKYPTKQNFIYMNQPFEEVRYDVIALNAKKQDIENYVYFNASLREHFHLGELSDYVDRFIPPAAHSVEWNLVGDASVGSFTIKKASGNATCDNSPCWEKDETDGQYPDGPFNKDSKSTQSEIGLTHTNVVDEIHFFDDRHILEQQPDIRFGRLNFKDVGGNQGMTIKVPLDVEVWQNGRFVTHFEDSATKTNGEHHTSTPIWSNSAPNNTLLSGEGSIIAGRTYGIVASQVDSAREQVRFHLDLSSAGNNLPWLKYNWDKSDADEDNPPTVVTFGIHRGNDRIIYRGEPNFIGMN
ncbi:DUF6701 domain-containing protein [Vibrio campbellii]|uniref:DUF6701 domain-containing protein n=1 Tax=Vibrio campbellii TaxID=680 RepID=UPI003857A957